MKKTNKTPDSLLRKYRKKQFETLEAFCKAFEEKHKEKLAVGTMSYYETGGSISSRRLDLIAEVLELSDYKKEKVRAEMWDKELKFRKPHKEYEIKRIRKKRSLVQEKTSVTVGFEKLSDSNTRKIAAHQSPGFEKKEKHPKIANQLRAEIRKLRNRIQTYRKALKLVS